MKVVIIGSGNVATVLARRMKECGIDIVQIISQNYNHATELGNKLKIPATDNFGLLVIDADFYMIAVTDANISMAVAQLPEVKGIILHTAGSVSKDVLKNFSNQYGVVYPLQTLNKHMQALPEIPVLIDGNTDAVKDSIKQFVKIWADGVVNATDQQRMSTHLAAVIVNNFTNHLVALTEDYCLKEGIDFSMLMPLISQTVENLSSMPAAQLQTGPAARGDISTVDKHLQLLNRYPSLRNLYLKLSESIINHKRKNSVGSF